MFLLGGLKGVIVVCQLDTGKRSILMHYYSLDEFNCEYLNLVVQGLDFYNGIYIWACIQLRPCLDVVGFTSIHMCWSGLRWNLVQFPLQSTPTYVD